MFHLSRLKNDIAELNEKKLKRLHSMNPKKVLPSEPIERLNEMKRKLKYLLEVYYYEDRIVSELFKSHAEYYNNLLKPLNDARSLAAHNLAKYERKCANQEKSNKYMSGAQAQHALQQLREHVRKLNDEIRETNRHIDNHLVASKNILIDLYRQVLERMSSDRVRFIQPRTQKYQLFFDLVTKNRTQK